MLNTLTHNPSGNTMTDAHTLEFINPTALRCHCPEYRVNRFCTHLVYYTVAKIQVAQVRNPEKKGGEK